MKDTVENGQIDVSIIMPCLNEAETLAQCIEMAHEAADLLELRHGLTTEIIVADNGSDDGSRRIARRGGARVIAVAERGYGAALLGGFRAADGRFLVMGDADCSYDFRESVAMIEALMDGADLCMGSRFKGEIKDGAMPWKNRYIGNPALSAILRLFFRTKVSDSHCGLRALTKPAFERLRLSAEGMEFASEMVLKAALKRMTIAEVPVTLSPDGRNRPPHLNPWRDGFRHLFFMFMLSPTWLFMIPSLVMTVLGVSVFTALISQPDREMVQLGNFGIGDHWAVVASAAVILGAQTFIFGFASILISYRDGYLDASAHAHRILGHSHLGSWLLAGMALTGIGLIWATMIAGGWIQSGFGELNEMRSLIAAFTIIVVGVQTCFGGFLLSVIAGNNPKHATVL